MVRGPKDLTSLSHDALARKYKEAAGQVDGIPALIDLCVNAIGQRSQSRHRMLLALSRSFSYEEGNENMSYEQFKRGLSHCGCGLSDMQVLALMGELDVDHKGSVAFQDLLRLVLGSEKTQLEKERTEKQQFYRQQLQWKKPDKKEEAIKPMEDKGGNAANGEDHSPIALENLRLALACKGIRAIVSLEDHLMRVAATSEFQTLSLRDFRRALHEEGLVQRIGSAGLEERDIRALYQKFQRKFDSGGINGKKLMEAVRGRLGRRREAVVKAAFKWLDTEGVGLLDKTELLRRYDATQHPDVQNGRRSVSSVYREFVAVLESLGSETEKGPEGVITRQEWHDYNTNLSLLEENDDYFELLIMNTWHGPGADAQHAVGGGTSRGEPMQPSAVDRIGRIREAKQRDVDRSRNGRTLGGAGEKAESEERAKAVSIRRKLQERAKSVGLDDFRSWFDQFSGNNGTDSPAGFPGESGRNEPLVLSQKQMRRALSRLGVRLEEAELSWLLNRLDAGRSGRVDVKSFIDFVQRGRGAEAYATDGGGYGDCDERAYVVGRGAKGGWEAQQGANYAHGAHIARDQQAATLERIRRKLREGGMLALAKLEAKLRLFAKEQARSRGQDCDEDLGAEAAMAPDRQWIATAEVSELAAEKRLKVDVEHFVEIMRSFDLGVSASMLGELYHSWCKPIRGGQRPGRSKLRPLSASECMSRIRGLDILNEQKQRAVWEAFKYLDADARCAIPLEFMLDRFDPTQHPACVESDKSAAAIYRDFLRTFPSVTTATNGRSNSAGGRSGRQKGRGSEGVMVSTKDWLQYHTNLAFCHPDDEAFAIIVYGCWQVSSRGGMVGGSRQRHRQQRGNEHAEEGGDDNGMLQQMLRHKRGPARAPRVMPVPNADRARELEEAAAARAADRPLVVPPWGTGDSSKSPTSLRSRRDGSRSGGAGGWTVSDDGDGASLGSEWGERHESAMVRTADGSYKSPGRGVGRQARSTRPKGGCSADAAVLYSGEEGEVMAKLRLVLMDTGLRGINALEHAVNAHAPLQHAREHGAGRSGSGRGTQNQTMYLGGYGAAHSAEVRCDATNSVTGVATGGMYNNGMYIGLRLSTYEFRQALRQWAQQVQPSAKPWLTDKDIAVLAARFGSYVQSGGDNSATSDRSNRGWVGGSGGSAGGGTLRRELGRFDAADANARFGASSANRPVRQHYQDEVFAGAFMRELLGIGVNGPADRPWRRVMINIVFDELVKRYRGRKRGGKELAKKDAKGSGKGLEGALEWADEADRREEEARKWPMGSIRQKEAQRWAKIARERARKAEKQELKDTGQYQPEDDGGEGCPLEWLLDTYNASKHPDARKVATSSKHPSNPNSLYRDLVAAISNNLPGADTSSRSVVGRDRQDDLRSQARVRKSDWMTLQLKLSCLMPDNDEHFRAVLCTPWGCNPKIVDKQASALAGRKR
jgi:Ca2+-binding EF-hand superfamily protein